MFKRKKLHSLVCLLSITTFTYASSVDSQSQALRHYSSSISSYKKVLADDLKRDIHALQGLAKDYAHTNQHAQAIATYKKLLAEDPKNRINYLIALGWQYLWIEKPHLASKYFTAAHLLDPTNTNAERGLYESKHFNLYQARILIKQKQWEAALKLLQPFSDSTRPKVQLDLATVYAALGQHKQAVKHYEKLLDIDPYYQAKVIVPLAYQYLWAQEFKKSQRLFEEYLGYYPNDKKAKQGLFEASHPNLYLARIARNQNQVKKSIYHYNKLVNKYPHNILFLKESAQAYTRDDNIPAALKIYHKLIYRYHDKTSYLQYAWLLLWSGQPQKARHFFILAKQQGEDPEMVSLGLMDTNETFQNDSFYTLQTKIYAHQMKQAEAYAWKILKRDPKNASWYSVVAEAFSAAGYNKISRKILLKGIQMSPKDRLILLPDLAWNNFWLGNEKQACKTFYKLKGSTEDPLSIDNAIGYCIDYFKGHKAAIKYYQNLSKDKNGDEYTEWQLRIAYLYIMDREYDKAEKVLGNILKVEHYNLDALVDYGNTFAFRGYNMQAVRWYQKALEVQPTNPVLQEHLGRAYYWLDMGDKALATYAKPVAMRPKRYYQHWDSAKRAFSNRLYVSYNHLHNSDKLTNNDVLFEWQHYISGRTSLNSILNLGYLKGAVDSGKWGKALFGFKTYLGGLNNSHGIIYPHVYLGAGDYLGWTPFLWDLSANWRKSDHFSMLFQTKDEPVLDSIAQGHHILFGYMSVDPTYFSDPWLIQGRLLGGRFSDNDNRLLTNLTVLRDIYRPYALYIGPSFEYFTDSNPNTDRGYYNPKSYTELAFIVKSDIKLAEKWYLYPYIKYGVFNDDTNSSFKQKVFDARLQLAYRIKLYEDLAIQASYLKSGSGGFTGGGGGGEGFKAFAFDIDYHYYF